jgi:hypothetical protein
MSCGFDSLFNFPITVILRAGLLARIISHAGLKSDKVILKSIKLGILS